MTKKETKEIKKSLIETETSITELARIIGYTRGYVSNVINGHFTNPPAEVVRRIYQALKDLADNRNQRAA